MEVSIKGVTYEYNPDGGDVWKRKKDRYTFTTIGGTECFVKRFEKKPSGWELVCKLEQKKPDFIERKKSQYANLPFIYDAVVLEKGGSFQYYIFEEKLKGDILKKRIQSNGVYDVSKLTKDIISALTVIHKQGFWFGDFNEENIFWDEAGNYYLIDIDSCWPYYISPSEQDQTDGGLPGSAQDYAGIVLRFYRHVIKDKQYIYQDLIYQDLIGKNLNLLQLLALITRLTIILERPDGKEISQIYSQRKLNKEIHYTLARKNPIYAEGVFIRALQESTDSKNGQPITPIRSLQVQEVMTLAEFIIGLRRLNTKKAPIIYYFDAFPDEITQGGTTELRWQVKDAESILLLYKSTKVEIKSSSSITVSPREKTVYYLHASNKSGDTSEKKCEVHVLRQLDTKPSKNKKLTEKYTKKSGLRIKKFRLKNIRLVLLYFIVFVILNIYAFLFYSLEVWLGDQSLKANDFTSAESSFAKARGFEKFILFSAHNVSEKIAFTNYSKFKHEGDSLYAMGFFATLQNGVLSSALDSYTKAISFKTDDSLQKRIEICTLVARAMRLQKENIEDSSFIYYKRAYELDDNEYLRDLVVESQRNLFIGNWNLVVKEDTLQSRPYIITINKNHTFTIDRQLYSDHNYLSGTWEISRNFLGSLIAVLTFSDMLEMSFFIDAETGEMTYAGGKSYIYTKRD